MFVTKKERNEIMSLPAQELDASQVGVVRSGLARRILTHLADVKEDYASAIARTLDVHEQKVYYHLRQLEKAGLIVPVASNSGEVGPRFYHLAKPAFVFTFKEFEPSARVDHPRGESSFFDPFISDGELDALVVVGSPDPHGPEMARSRDGYYGIDLGLFLGTFLNYVPRLRVRLDTEMRDEDYRNNLILIGGPVVNMATKQINPHLPIYFDKDARHALRSTLSGKLYPEEECGLVCSTPHPLAKGKRVLIVAGNRHAGTRAAIIAFLRHFKELTTGNAHDSEVHARVVEGVDNDADGIVDAVEFLE